MDLNEAISRYPAIAETVSKMGKIKQSAFNKKRMAEAIELWERFSPEELAQLNSEIGNAKMIGKKVVVTPTAVCYFDSSVFFAFPVRDIMWFFPRIVTEKTYFIPISKTHQLFMMERTGNYHILCSFNTGGFSKKTPAADEIEAISKILTPVRKGIRYGYSKELEAWFSSDLPAAVARIDEESEQ